MKRQGRVWIRVFPDVPVSKKPAEVRMGKGKGAVEYWAARVKPGRIMFEIDGVPDDGRPRGAARSARPSCRSSTRFVDAAGERGALSDEAIEDLRAKTADQLQRPAAELKKEQFNLRFQKATGQLENTARVREVRRDIARIKTVLGASRPRAAA